MFPLFIAYNFYSEYKEHIAGVGVAYCISGYVGTFIFSKTILGGIGRLKYWAIFVSLMSCLSQ